MNLEVDKTYLVKIKGLHAPRVAIYRGDNLWQLRNQSFATRWDVTEIISQLNSLL